MATLEDQVVLLVLPQQQAADGRLLGRDRAAHRLHGEVARWRGLEQAWRAEIGAPQVPTVGRVQLYAVVQRIRAVAKGVMPGPC